MYDLSIADLRNMMLTWPVLELDGIKIQLQSKNASLQAELETSQHRITNLTNNLDQERRTLDDERRAHRLAFDDLQRDHRNEIDKLRRDLEEERRHEVDKVRRELIDEVERLIRVHREELRELERRSNLDLEDERRQRMQEMAEIKTRISMEQQSLDLAVGAKDREIQNMRGELEDVRGELDREQTLKNGLQKTLVETSSKVVSLESNVRSLQKHVEFLESGSKAQSDSFVSLERQLQEALEAARISQEKLVHEETLRRILFNQVQELKGNIRVMCRVRPPSTDEKEVAKIAFPDTDKEGKELEIQGPEEVSSLGKVTRKPNAFTFDRVFGPASSNEEVFGEISQLVQSALDGYNVCIFCYGQTGSGKTHTMSSKDGMIPRATHMIYGKARGLEEKGWKYAMEGSFVEVYNEEIHDLLGSEKEFKDGKKKHEIRHDEARKQTVVTGLKTVPLDSADTVELMLKQADNNRSVAATLSNSRSSRSHSVFILKLLGRNERTGETSEGTLNLVDLAGSERLKSSGAEGDRMKETQNINKSLSCLGDVIGALGSGKEGGHVPYRNSKVRRVLLTERLSVEKKCG
jgi:kinesin family protein C1